MIGETKVANEGDRAYILYNNGNTIYLRNVWRCEVFNVNTLACWDESWWGF